MDLNRAALDAVNTGFRTTFNNAFASAPATYLQVATEVPSSNAQEIYAWLGSFPIFREWIGDRQVQNLALHDFTIKNKTFEATVSVKRESIEDDSYGVYAPLIAQMGQSAKRHPDFLVYSLMKAAFSTLCYDGQYFFDTDHLGYDANGAETSVSNMTSGAGAPWFLLATKGVVKPFIFQKRRDYKFTPLDALDSPNVFLKNEYVYGSDARVNAGLGLWQLAYGSKGTLDATGYDAARSAMGGLRGAGGQSLNIVPDLLVVPPSLEGAGRRLLTAEKNDAGADNVWRGTAQLLVVPELA